LPEQVEEVTMACALLSHNIVVSSFHKVNGVLCQTPPSPLCWLELLPMETESFGTVLPPVGLFLSSSFVRQPFLAYWLGKSFSVWQMETSSHITYLYWFTTPAINRFIWLFKAKWMSTSCELALRGRSRMDVLTLCMEMCWTSRCVFCFTLELVQCTLGRLHPDTCSDSVGWILLIFHGLCV
jgi:hypothetical protein